MPQSPLGQAAVIVLWPDTARTIVDFDVANNLALVIAVMIDAVAVEQFVHELHQLVPADAMSGATDDFSVAVHGKDSIYTHSFEFLLNNELDHPSSYYHKYTNIFSNQETR
jgi:hypothetical protein